MNRSDEDSGTGLHFRANPLDGISDLSDDDLLEQVARRIVRMGLGVPAVFFLESTKPLAFLGSQALTFLAPFVKAFLTVRTYDQFVRLMEDRANIEQLIVRIEHWEESPERPPLPPEPKRDPSWLSRLWSGKRK